VIQEVDVTTTQGLGPQLTDEQFLRELEPMVGTEIDRHAGMHKDWMPHQYVPFDEGRTFPGVLPGGLAWDVEQSRVSPEIRTALIMNLLTEDNLPSYHREIAGIFGGDGAWPHWVHRWTAEEARHSIAIRDYLLVTRAVDPDELEHERMAHMSMGYDAAHGPELLHGLAYVSFQELATRVSHRNTGRLSDDPMLDQLMNRIALDENLHMIFYRNLLAGALDLSPSQTLRAIVDVVKQFEMPGSNVEGFARRSAQMANIGIYDPRQHLDDVLNPVLRHWKIFELENLDADGEQAREELAAYLAGLETVASRFVERRDARLARQAARLA
jgi:acyl-[acyl-carrier-protein] desaturase